MFCFIIRIFTHTTINSLIISHAHNAHMITPSTPHFQVIEADDSHMDFIAHFGSQSFVDAYKEALSLTDLKAYTQRVFSKATIAVELHDPAISFFICKDSKANLCGYAKLIQSPPPLCITANSPIELQRLYIDKPYRDQGAGKLLSKYAEAHILKEGFNSLWLRVWTGNNGAVQKYLNWNYAIVGEESYQVGQEQRSVILMHKDIR